MIDQETGKSWLALDDPDGITAIGRVGSTQHELTTIRGPTGTMRIGNQIQIEFEGGWFSRIDGDDPEANRTGAIGLEDGDHGAIGRKDRSACGWLVRNRVLRDFSGGIQERVVHFFSLRLVRGRAVIGSILLRIICTHHGCSFTNG